MDRPFADKRPFGPFINLRDDVSYFDKVEVQTNAEGEETIYTVAGILPSGNIGLTVDTNALTINGEGTFALFERKSGGQGLPVEEYTGDAGVEFISTGDSKVGIGQASRNLTNIVIE